MLERGYVLEYDAVSETYNKVYVDLTCETENLQWESVGDDIFETCAGESVTENIEDPLDVYPIKWEKKLRLRGLHNTSGKSVQMFYDYCN